MLIAEETVMELYDAYRDELYTYALRFVRTREMSEDILHDSFVRLIEYSEHHEIRMGTIKPFLYRITHNLCVNALKKNRPLSTGGNGAHEIADRSDVSKNHELDELNDKIDELVDTLDDESRSIFIMRKDLGMSFEEIAANLGISERTVRRKIAGALSFLAEQLKKTGYIDSYLILLSILLG
ncbi:MAG TPA: sigma-70 family RNA polymerase sigma factor [Spirochaetota bacterium]|nr:sigma-70 family RNA polymerase sigma factor [Spirochaetota bacterium]HNT11902.1 sigma-70 family RNA polymerase sigma factor [Spirochaetota bacterium]